MCNCETSHTDFILRFQVHIETLTNDISIHIIHTYKLRWKLMSHLFRDVFNFLQQITLVVLFTCSCWRKILLPLCYNIGGRRNHLDAKVDANNVTIKKIVLFNQIFYIPQLVWLINSESGISIDQDMKLRYLVTSIYI